MNDLAIKIDDRLPTVPDISVFDHGSGSFIERLLFNSRLVIVVLFFFATVFFGFEATHIRVNADFDKMIPTHQGYIVNFLNHYDDLQSRGNALTIVVQADRGTIINAHYLAVLKNISDEIYLLPNVNRSFMTSLWTPNSHWTAVTSGGIASGPIIDQSYNGSSKQLSIVEKTY